MKCRAMPSEALDAERQVLGAILLDDTVLPRIRGLLPAPGYFRHAMHRKVYAAALGLADRGSAVDVVTLSDALGPAALTDIGGIDALIALDQTAATSVNIEHHAELVRDAAQRRHAANALQGAMAALADHGDWRGAVERLEGDLASLDADAPRAEVTLADAADAAIAAAQVASERGVIGLPTGLADLDRLLGGLEPGHLIVLAGRPGMGKTALGLDIAARVAEGGAAVAIASLEMPSRELGGRMLCRAARVDGARLRAGRLSQPDIDRLLAARQQMDHRIVIDDTPSATVNHLHGLCARLRARRDAPPLGLLVVDYLQLMGGQGRSREEEVARNSRALKALAKRVGIPVLLLAQLNRECERRPDKRPLLSDLRESGAVEQDADAVVLLFRADYYEPAGDAPGVAEAIVAKNRHGPTGIARLRFLPAWSRFEALAD